MSQFLVQILRQTKAGMRGYSRCFTDESEAVQYADENPTLFTRRVVGLR